MQVLYLKGHKQYETFVERKETYCSDAPSHELVKRRYRKFKHGPESVETAPKSVASLLPLRRHLSVNLGRHFGKSAKSFSPNRPKC